MTQSPFKSRDLLRLMKFTFSTKQDSAVGVYLAPASASLFS